MKGIDSIETTEKPEVTTKIIEEILTQSGQTIGSVKEVKRLYPKRPPKQSEVKMPSPNIQQKDPRIFVNFTSMKEYKEIYFKIQENQGC